MRHRSNALGITESRDGGSLGELQGADFIEHAFDTSRVNLPGSKDLCEPL